MELKFRVWDIRNKSFIGAKEDATYYMPKTRVVGSAIVIEPYDSQYELLLSTGLKDSCGQEVYEGDIIETTDLLGYKRLELIGNVLEFLQDYGFAKEECGSYKNIFIVGNKYENPELLEDLK